MRRSAPNPSEPANKRLAMVLGHEAEAAAGLDIYGPAAPSDLAGVGLEHAEDDAHGGGLAGAVGPGEPEHLPLGDEEGQVVEGDQGAAAAGQALEFEHVAPLHWSS
jgi:hypothetical protein